MRIPIDKIKIGERMRKDIGNLQSLQDSLSRVGLLHPIIIDTNDRLIAGMRRLEAARRLDWDTIDVLQLDIKNTKDRILLEAEENTVRLDFTAEEIERIASKLECYKNQSFLNRLRLWFLEIWYHIKQFIK